MLIIGLLALFCWFSWDHFDVFRFHARWLLYAPAYKAQLLAQPAKKGQLQHYEWDGWGFAGLETSAFLVYDPSDGLLAAAQSHKAGKYPGIPCRVPLVVRLESQWYAARFFTNDYWQDDGGCFTYN